MAGLFQSRNISNGGMPPEGRAIRSGIRIPPFDDLRWPSNAFLRSLPMLTIVKLGVSAWRYTWADTTAPYGVYLNGELIDSVPTAEWEADLVDFITFPPPIEVIDANGNTGLVDTYLYPPFAQIQWYGDPSATNYYIEEKVSGDFIRRQIVNENNQGYHLFRTEVLLEGINAWRVIPVDFIGNKGTPVDFVFNIVPPPLPPETVPVTFSAGSIVVGP